MALNENDPAEKRSIEARDQNKMACTTLMLAMPDDLIVLANTASKGDANWSHEKHAFWSGFYLTNIVKQEP